MPFGAGIILALYAGITAVLAFGASWPLWFLVLPRVLGAPVR